MASETFEVSLHGGSPWGFRLQGGKEFRAPLLIAKVSKQSLNIFSAWYAIAEHLVYWEFTLVNSLQKSCCSVSNVYQFCKDMLYVLASCGL